MWFMSVKDKMESAIVKSEKDAQKKGTPSNGMCKDKELSDKNGSSPNRLVKKVNPKHVLVFNVIRSRNGECSIQKSFIRHIRSLDRRIPRHIIGHEEKYLKHCLEQIYASAAKSSSFTIPGTFGYSSNFYDSSSELKIRSRYAGDFTGFLPDAAPGDIAVSPSREWIVGAISGSKSITKILESPLFHQSGRTKFINAVNSPDCDSMSPPVSHKMGVLGNECYRSELVDKRVASVSSSSSTISDQSFSSSSAGVTQGMLHCTWTDGLPHYAFSLDDQKEVYVANGLRPESLDHGKAIDYMYMFYSRAGERKEHDFHMNEFNLIGKMRVTTTSRLCPNDSEVKETEFVLSGVDEVSPSSSSTSSHVVKKNKGLSKKMVEVFKTGHPSRERSSSKFGGTNTEILSDDHISPNLELAAVIVRAHTCARREVTKVGGWGLKFLKKVDAEQDESSEAQCSESSSLRNASGCSTSMDVIVPAGFHGGPRNGGPCGLVDRWRSGGHCDCGGWDLGCPLTILDTNETQNEVLLQESMQGHCRSLDLFVQGSTPGAPPVMKMVNIRDGLYFIHFHPRLSPLQCLSIAVANIHTQSPPAIQSRVYRS